MKKITVILLSLIILVYFCACNNAELTPYNGNTGTGEYEGLYFQLDSDKFVCTANEDYVLPQAKLYDKNNRIVENLEILISLYDGNFDLVAIRNKTVNVPSGYYMLTYKLKNALTAGAPEISAMLYAKDKNEEILFGFNDEEEMNYLRQPPTINFGTQKAEYSLMKEGYKNSYDGVLKVLPCQDEGIYRDGVGIMFKNTVYLDEIKSVQINIMHETNDFNGRITFGFYDASGASWDSWWYHQTKNSWLTIEIFSDTGDKAISDFGGEYNGTLTKIPTDLIKGIYIKSVFSVSPFYIDSISVIKK